MVERNIYIFILGKKVLLSGVIALVLLSLAWTQSAQGENLLRAPDRPLKGSINVGRGDSKPSHGFVKQMFSGPIVLWRKIMSKHWGISCSHYPSCSRYSLLTIEKHGPIIGFVMTFDRLQHESNEARYSPVLIINGETKVFDPVENNDFWWYAK